MTLVLPGTQVEARGLAWEVVQTEPAGEQQRYRLRWCDGGAYSPETMAGLYAFMGQAIASKPGRWWAMDLLPNLPEARPVELHEATP